MSNFSYYSPSSSSSSPPPHLRNLYHCSATVYQYVLPALAAAAVFLYLAKVNTAMTSYHPDALALAPERWTDEKLKQVFAEVEKTSFDETHNLPARKNRRYVVVGGGGLVGGWIVKQLLERGESPSAIRILDLRPPVRPDVIAAHVDFVRTDITSPESVHDAFAKSWPGHNSHRPLTVFHTAAMIGFAERAKDLMLPYYRVNVLGTENVLNAAREADATCFICTSSGSAGMRAPKFLMKPWQAWPRHHVQILNDATLPHYQGHDDFLMNYSVTKAEAELLVTNANNLKGQFLTGAIRPGHAIFGHGTENTSSLTYDYLTRGGGPSWLHNIIASFISAENVAVAHLNYEDALLDPSASPSISGRAFYVTDPNKPISYADFYKGLEILPNTPVRFIAYPPAPLLLLSHVIEFYILVRHRYLSFLPKLTGDFALLQPPLFNVGSTNIIVSNEQAGRSPAEGGIGYKGTVTTIEAMCKAVLEWNESHPKLEHGTAK